MAVTITFGNAEFNNGRPCTCARCTAYRAKIKKGGNYRVVRPKIDLERMREERRLRDAEKAAADAEKERRERRDKYVVAGILGGCALVAAVIGLSKGTPAPAPTPAQNVVVNQQQFNQTG